MTKVVFTNTIKVIILLISLLFTGVFVAGYFYVVVPKNEEIQSVKKEMADNEKEIQETDNLIAQLSESPKLADSEEIKGVPNKLEIKQYFSEIESLLIPTKVGSGVLEEGVLFLATTDPNRTLYYGTYTFKFTAENITFLTEFLTKLEANSRFIKFNSFEYSDESILSKDPEASSNDDEDKEKTDISIVYDVLYLDDTTPGDEEKKPK